MRTARTIDGVDFRPGRKFRVVKPGLCLRGWVPVVGASQGWGHDLNVGDVVECLGHGPGMGSDPGHGLEFTSEAAREAGAFHVEIQPNVGGIWNFHPPVDSLEPVDD